MTVRLGLSPWICNTAGMLQAVPSPILGIDYEADGQTREIRYASGVVTRFTYSPQRRWLTRIETLAPGGSPALMDYTYTRDAAGRIARIDGLTASSGWVNAFTRDKKAAVDQFVSPESGKPHRA
ncbi:MAG: hypothetical protein WAU86_12060 [Oricola sp.]